jgi:hypothetical protein
MSASTSKKSNTTTNNSADDQFVDVLYQKLGENWFAFSLIDDEVFMSPVSDDKIAEIKSDSTAVTNIRSNVEMDNEAA